MTAAAVGGFTAGAHPVIECRGVDHAYGVTPVLRQVDLSIDAGEMVAVMGPSGSGKTTLLHLMAGLIEVQVGEIVLRPRDGELVRLERLAPRRRTALRAGPFGVVFQFNELVPELSPAENVAVPLMLGGVRRRAAVSTARERLEELGLADVLDQETSTLSGGQAQRVAVARALVHRPQVLFADEPTGSLDSLAGEQVMDLIARQVAEHALSVVMVTHDHRVAAFADRTVTLRDGRLRDGLGSATSRGDAPDPVSV